MVLAIPVVAAGILTTLRIEQRLEVMFGRAELSSFAPLSCSKIDETAREAKHVSLGYVK